MQQSFEPRFIETAGLRKVKLWFQQDMFQVGQHQLLLADLDSSHRHRR
jgi:hypothetical protein